ncbi:MAG TPA: hypothetical protein VK002_13375 [Rubricoccaceae bacterium]|nr:hypothetical protein [Rubricoccaceae bacterium]
MLAVAGCSEDTNPLAPYEGGRPLDLLRVTQSFTPEIQWVGGRVAAVGVNRGTRAALDSTLVWIRTAPDNSISSFVGLEGGSDDALVTSYGGTPQDRLTDGETYTFWLAERSALDAALDSTRMEAGTFADTTLTLRLLLRGQNGGGLDPVFEIERDERLTGERFVVRWAPEGLRFRRLALREGPAGGFTNLIWHVLVPEGQPPSIASPVTIGVTPEGAEEVTPFRDTGFEPDTTALTYVLWGVTDEWDEENPAFGVNTPGYASFRILSCNFDIDDPCPTGQP